MKGWLQDYGGTTMALAIGVILLLIVFVSMCSVARGHEWSEVLPGTNQAVYVSSSALAKTDTHWIFKIRSDEELPQDVEYVAWEGTRPIYPELIYVQTTGRSMLFFYSRDDLQGGEALTFTLHCPRPERMESDD